jgi:type IV secretory pathway VirB6-like protein
MKKVQTHLKYGGLTGLIMVVLGLLVYVVVKDMKSPVGYIVYIPFVAGLIMNAIAYSKANGHYVTFGKVFSSCFKASAVIALCMVAWTLLSFVIFPEMKEAVLEMQYEEMSKNDAMSQEQIDQWSEAMDKYYGVMTVGAVMFGMMFWGAIISLLGAAIAKKKGDPPMFSDTLQQQ